MNILNALLQKMGPFCAESMRAYLKEQEKIVNRSERIILGVHIIQQKAKSPSCQGCLFKKSKDCYLCHGIQDLECFPYYNWALKYENKMHK